MMDAVTVPVWLIVTVLGVIFSIIGGLFALAHNQIMSRLDRIEAELKAHGEHASEGIGEVHKRLDQHISYHMGGHTD